MVLVSSTSSRNIENVNKAYKVFAEHGNFIRAVIRSQVKSEAQAEDIFQDFFLALVAKPIPPDVKDLKSYLYKAINNDIVDAVRRIESYHTFAHKYRGQLCTCVNNNGTENALIIKEEIDKVFELIAGRLPSSQSQAIRLRYANGLGVKAVAERMNINDRSVSHYVSVGLRKIRQLLITKANK
jgi:RNA polymerase sigma factor (sigma-70 family)